MSLTQAYTYDEVNDMRIPITKARPKLKCLMNKSHAKKEVITITSKGVNSVLMPESEYRSLMSTLEIYANPGFASKLKQRISDANAGINMAEHDLIEVSDEDNLE
jgi:prevent-host-death family protein